MDVSLWLIPVRAVLSILFIVSVMLLHFLLKIILQEPLKKTNDEEDLPSEDGKCMCWYRDKSWKM